MNQLLVAIRLSDLRKEKNWTQEELSTRLHVTRQAISKWENGITMPDLESLLKLSHLYGITINEILEPNNLIKSFEDIVTIEKNVGKHIIARFDRTEIAKAAMGASPSVNTYLQDIFDEIDIQAEIHKLGRVRIDEIEEIHSRIVQMINGN